MVLGLLSDQQNDTVLSHLLIESYRAASLAGFFAGLSRALICWWLANNSDLLVDAVSFCENVCVTCSTNHTKKSMKVKRPAETQLQSHTIRS